MTGIAEPTRDRVRVVHVRLATVRDVPHIARLEAELFPDAWSPAGLVPHTFRGNRRAGRAAWVAEPVRGAGEAVISSTVPAGYLLLSWVLDEGTVERIGVAPEHRRRGIGRALLERGIGALRERGVRQVWLEVGASNEAAIRLYEEAGFAPVSRRIRYYVGPPPDDAVVMRKLIA